MRIEVQDLVVDRDGYRAVDQASLSIKPGCWLGMIGANGSGKTSLLRAIAGRLPVTFGRILAGGRDRTDDREWRARRIGFAPDAASLPEGLSGRELFAIVAPDHAPGNGPLYQLRAALDFDSYLDRPIGTLSAGMRQRLAIYCAFLHRPALAILDEPLNWLDPICAFDTKEALRAMVDREGTALVTALHEMTTLVHYCDAGVLLSEGRLCWRLDETALTRGKTDLPRFEAELIAALRNRSQDH